MAVIIWRQVEHAQIRTGRGRSLGPDRTRRARWWVLDLDCGHQVIRIVRYKPLERPQRGGIQHRSLTDVLPVPERVRCEECQP